MALKDVQFEVKKGAPVNPEFKESDAWTCTFTYNKKKYSVPFYKGKGHKGKQPEVVEVLDCLFRDASGFENARNYEEFASEFGYDPDSRKGEKIYKACGVISKELKKLFGKDYAKIEKEVEKASNN